MNAVDRFAKHFPTNAAASRALGITTEAFRLMRRRGHVETRSRAVQMEMACGGKVTAAELLGVAPKIGPAAGRQSKKAA
jgi:hypothetical protein